MAKDSENYSKSYLKSLVLDKNNPSLEAIMNGNIESINQSIENMGYVVRVKSLNTYYTIWLSNKQYLIYCFPDDRINVIQEIDLKYDHDNLYIDNDAIKSNINCNTKINVSYLKVKDNNGNYYRELTGPNDLENIRFKKSNWFHCESPKDLWKYFINNSIYDPRTHNKINKRFKCQQCAYEWWKYFGYLYTCTGKRIYDIIQNEIALSIARDMGTMGEWRHGFWSDEMEIHSRFFLDGINLLISQYEKDGCEIWLQRAHIGMNYMISNLTDVLQDRNVWFLHDSIEDKGKHKFYSTLFGKNKYNSLCLNTHIQALCVLHRLTKYDTDDGYYTRYYKSGYKALHSVLNHKPAEYIYRVLVKLFVIHESQKNNDRIFCRFRRMIAARLIGRFYWKIKAKYPRIVLPGGFIERDINLSMLSDRYHIINVKDLLTLYMICRDHRLIPYIQDGVQFVETIIKKKSFNSLLRRSPYYIEYLDILQLYNDFIEPVPDDKLSEIENIMFETIGATSLDYYVLRYN